MSADDKSIRDQFKGLLALQEKGSSDSLGAESKRGSLLPAPTGVSDPSWQVVPHVGTCYYLSLIHAS
jgi:hypothetical protein